MKIACVCSLQQHWVCCQQQLQPQIAQVSEQHHQDCMMTSRSVSGGLYAVVHLYLWRIVKAALSLLPLDPMPTMLAAANAMQRNAGEAASSRWRVHPAHCTVQVPGRQ
jgi:hypothetical protein